MFGFFKKKKEPFVLTSPVAGELKKLSSVNDPVFAQKMMGDGIAVKPDESEIVNVYAPVSGKIVFLPNSKHAFGIETKDRKQILIHIGIDTVNLKGKGFTTYAEQGNKVKHGDKIISFDSNVIKSNKLDDIVMVIMTKGYDKKINPLVRYNQEVLVDQKLLA